MLKKIVIAEPPIEDFYFTPHRYMGLGSSIVEQLLTESGYSVKRFLFPMENPRGRSIPLPSILKFLKPYLISGIQGPVTYFKGWKLFGPQYEECAEKILLEKPDIICISSFAFCYADCTLKLSRELRKKGFSGCIIAGGAGPSCYSEYYLQDNSIDYVYQGEAETTFLEVIRNLSNNSLPQCSNLWKKNKTSLVPPEKVETPDFIMPAIQSRTNKQKLSISISFTRGCKFSCNFCSQFLTFGKGFRFTSLSSVLQLIEKYILKNSFKKISLNFEDDNLLQVPEVFEKLLIPLQEKFPQLEFLAENGLDYRLIDNETFTKLHQINFTQFNLSLGSLYKEKELNRNLHLSQYEKIQAELKKKEIQLITYFISGLAGDSPESIVDSLIYLASRETRIGISLFYPVPGIQGFEKKEYFQKNSSCLNCGSVGWPHNHSLSTRELITSFYISRWLNLYKLTDVKSPHQRLIQESIEKNKILTYSTGKENTLVCVPELCDQMVSYFFNQLKGEKNPTL